MSPPRIFYFAFDEGRPSGGEIDTYDHVDALNAAGFDAYALHTRVDRRHDWFDNATRTIEMRSFWDIYDRTRDYIVLPETLGHRILAFPGKKVIFNKNLFYGCESLGLAPVAAYPYEDANVVAVFATSVHNLSHLAFAFPHARLFRMFTRIDATRFGYVPLHAKQRRICVVDKAHGDLAVLGHLLRARARRGENALASYDWMMLSGLSQQQLAEQLRGALILVSLSTHEGLPRTVLEGLACGCLVLSYGSGPLVECLPLESICDRDDFRQMAARIEEITSAFPGDVEKFTPWAATRRAIAERFTRERQRDALLAAWDAILSGGAVDARGEDDALGVGAEMGAAPRA